MKKITRATLKSFIRKNREQLLLKVESKFCGMSDMVEKVEDVFEPAVASTQYVDGEDVPHVMDNNLGIAGVWLVLSGRDYITAFETEELTGLNVYNCCGEFTVAIKK